MDVQAHHYYAAKRAYQSEGNFDVAAQPRWLKTMPQVYDLTLSFTTLLDQLTAVRSTHNVTVIKNYFKKVAAELIKIYTYRLRIIELSTSIPENDKATLCDQLIEECQQRLNEIRLLLNYDNDRT